MMDWIIGLVTGTVLGLLIWGETDYSTCRTVGEKMGYANTTYVQETRTCYFIAEDESLTELYND